MSISGYGSFFCSNGIFIKYLNYKIEIFRITVFARHSNSVYNNRYTFIQEGEPWDSWGRFLLTFIKKDLKICLLTKGSDS